MSSEKYNIFDIRFDSYSDALSYYLKSRGLTQKWLVEEIIEPGQKFESLQQQMSRWIRGDTVSHQYQVKINNALDISIKCQSDGKWIISRTDGPVHGYTNERTEAYTIDELLKEERSRLGIEDIPDTERGRELQGMLDDAVSLVLKIRRSIEMEKKRAVDDD